MMQLLNARHPDDIALSRWLEDGMPENGSRVARHVATCDRCTRRTEAWAALRGATRGLAADADSAPPAVLDRVLATRLSAPTGSIVAIEEPPANSSNRARRLAALAAAALLVTVVWSSWSPTRLEAGLERGRLSVAGAGPLPGTQVPLRYEPIPALAGEDSVLVRMRVVSDAIVDRGWRTEQSVVLKRSGDVFAGPWPFATDAVLATAAVEGFDGETVDANGNQLFLLLAQDRNGRPTLGGLFQYFRGMEFQPRQWTYWSIPQRDSTIRSMLRRYYGPSAERWAVEGADRRDMSWIAFIRDFTQRTWALARLDRSLKGEQNLPWRTRRAMAAFAEQQEEPEVAAEWRSRLPEERGARGVWSLLFDIKQRRDTAAARVLVRSPAVTREIDFGSLALGLGPSRPRFASQVALLTCEEILIAVREASTLPFADQDRPIGLSRREFERFTAERRAQDLGAAQACPKRVFDTSTPLKDKVLTLWFVEPSP